MQIGSTGQGHSRVSTLGLNASKSAEQRNALQNTEK
jgi:hypothetical protein